ncbi:fucosyltransferase 2 [Rhynchospora pubera]|uniref:Fucosyltransferase n=1 Tax=Rhynchospora pubera TaxID=906938 RepID=A0AAV8HI96_9POAL|nr:fucosyltransferase 2 [Rhynchospora pubera]
MRTLKRIKSQDKAVQSAALFSSSRRVRFIAVACAVVFLLVFCQLNSSVLWLQGISISLHQESTGLKGRSYTKTAEAIDNLLGGLLSPNFDEQSCQSRYQSSAYRKPSPHKPSSYLLSRLRNYEELHKRCGPKSPLYQKSIHQLKSGHSMGLMECNYLVWSPFNGLGNRMMTIASAFVYALLTNRVLLLHITEDMLDLFCEPFPDSTWVLPSDFPVKDLEKLNLGSEQTYGNYLKNKKIKTDVKVMAESLPPYVYLHLEHDYQHLDRLFFCDNDQQVLAKVNWLLIKSDIYFVPGLFFLSLFEDELKWMFPERETVFHHLSRYLFHPTNSVWGMITRYYISYMAKADEKMGIQIRTFSWMPISIENFANQILACSWQENLLPSINQNMTQAGTNGGRTKAVLITSLNSEYCEKMKSMYYEHTTSTGEIISFSQPSHEETQHTEKQTHNQKALAEMFLLSYCDVLVTSGWSTFGYVAQGIASLKPWILLSSKDQKAPNPPCRRAMSMEPCFHAPPSYDCKANKNVDFGAILRHVKHCEDVGNGIKLYD